MGMGRIGEQLRNLASEANQAAKAGLAKVQQTYINK